MKTKAETDRLRGEGLFHGEDAILAAKEDGEEFARQERERRVGRRKRVSSRGNCSCSKAQR